jgi:predicted metal-binding membrane protein
MASDGSDAIMAKMGMPMSAQWSARDFAFTFAMWSVMMVGMMTPTAAPVFFLFSDMKNSRADPDATMSSTLFGAGYLIVWVAFSTAAALAQFGLHQGMWLSSSMAVTSSRIGGVILIAAGAYQLTPTKGACLRQCQSPLGFLMSHWRDGRTGSLQMGMRHGLYCLGCCWALMSVLFVVGVMNLAWVATLTAFIFIEKFGRTGVLVARLGGLVMIVLGILNLME